MKEKFVVIDGNSLAFRAFYGLPPLSNREGEPCGAIYGFCKMLINVIQKLSPKYLVVAFDAGKHTFRHNIFADYKGTRKPTPEEFKVQIPLIKSLLVEMGIKVIEIPEIEADDIIGSIAKKFDEEMILVSGDRDLLQLIDEKTHCWLTVKGISEILDVDIPTLKEKFGIEPYQVIEMKSIKGDTSDNIPGIKGIGDKTALKLIEEYSSLDNIYKNIENISGRTKTLLQEQKDMAYMSKTLATIKTDVPLDIEKEDCIYQFPFSLSVLEMMKRFEFKSIIEKSELFNIDNNVAKSNIIYEERYIQTIDEFESLCKDIKTKKTFAINILKEFIDISIDNVEYHIDNFLTANFEFYPMLGELLTDDNIEKICFDVKAIKHFFYDINIAVNNYFDVSLALYLVNESEGVLNYAKVQESRGLDLKYSACNLVILKDDLKKLLIERGQIDLYNNVELKLIEVLFEMEISGIKINKAELVDLTQKYKLELDEISEQIHKLAGSDININSPKQLQKLLFEDLHLTYKGKKSTNVEVLEAIKDQHEIIEYILRYRKIAKIISTYLDGLVPTIKENDIIHTTFMQSFTSTGRLSSREPNMQNIPVRDEESKILRKMFISRFEGGNIMSADYNQIELRLMAIFSKDENLLSDFNHRIDVHSMTASKIFNISPDQVTSKERRVAKAVNFGIIYGISEYGLSKNINVTPKQAKDFIARYFELYPKVKDYMNASIEFGKNNGFVKTYFNRIRHIPELKSSNFAIRSFGERVALNMPLQGTASDIIKLAMIKVYNNIKRLNLKSKLILQIHDELLIDVYPGEEDACKKVLLDNMTSVVNFELPLEIAISYGKTWLDAK